MAKAWGGVFSLTLQLGGPRRLPWKVCGGRQGWWRRAGQSKAAGLRAGREESETPTPCAPLAGKRTQTPLKGDAPCPRKAG